MVNCLDGGTGTFRQSGGSVTISGLLYIGSNGGTGTYWQTGGVVTNYGHCVVGRNGGNGGRYVMEGGSLAVTMQALRIGLSSPGEFSISNGTVDVTYQTWVGENATGNGTFSGVPSLDVKGYSIRLSSDRKRVVVVRKGLTIIIQ